jgi:small subunit ribosomal protein S6e
MAQLVEHRSCKPKVMGSSPIKCFFIMAIKIVIGLKNGKCFQKELSREESEALYNRVLGETIKGELFGLQGSEFTITGGSDGSGFPMRRDLPGSKKKRILMTKGVGFRGKLRKKRFGGLRVKKTIAGNTIYENTNQVNLKCIKGDNVIENAFKKEEAPKESNEQVEEKKE